MNNSKVLFKSVFASMLVCAAGFATAADNQNLTVNAVVNGVCKFTTSAQTLSFGTIDPSAVGPLSASGATVSYKCTKDTTGAAVTFGDGLNSTGVGARQMKLGATTNVLPYTLSATGGGVTGTGFGTGSIASSLTFNSQITAANYANLPAGTYTDTVLMSISP